MHAVTHHEGNMNMGDTAVKMLYGDGQVECISNINIFPYINF
jgi:hypothetical protein